MLLPSHLQGDFLKSDQPQKNIHLRNHASTPPGGFAASGALHEIPVVVAAVHLVMAVTGVTHGVARRAEGTLAPTCMDDPRPTASGILLHHATGILLHLVEMPAASVPASSMPAASTPASLPAA